VIKGSALAQMIAKTQFAITGEDTRYYLNGALFVLKPDQMTFVATDGHRLALVHADRESTSKGEEVKAILPRKALAELGRLLADTDADVNYERGENHLFFEIGPRLLMSRMIDGQFPAYEKVVPKSNDKHVEFERDRLMNAVRRVALLSNERSRAVKFVVGKGSVEVTSSSPEFGEAREPIAVDYDGVEITICFNAQYVLDFLNAVESEIVALDLKDDVSQAVMKPVGVQGYDYTYVIMPMRV
jgi:DNA polymerase-3 subunit beta